MTGPIIFGCILLFFIFILSVSVKITVAYSSQLELSVKILCFKIKILPKKEKKKGPHSMSKRKAEKIKAKLLKKEQKKAEKKKAKAEKKRIAKETPKTETEKEKKSLSEILDIIAMVRSIIATVVKKFFGHLKIDIARIKIKLATGDAANTAIAYGAVTQSINLLFPILERIKNFKLPKNTDISVDADFLSESSDIDVCVSFSLRPWHLFHVAFAALFTFIKSLVKSKIKNAQKSEPIMAKAPSAPKTGAKPQTQKAKNKK